MSKVVRLLSKDERQSKEELKAFVEQLLAKVDAGEIKSLMIAADGSGSDEGIILTGWTGLDYNQRAVMISHMQMDLVKSFIEVNYITP